MPAGYRSDMTWPPTPRAELTVPTVPFALAVCLSILANQYGDHQRQEERASEDGDRTRRSPGGPLLGNRPHIIVLVAAGSAPRTAFGV